MPELSQRGRFWALTFTVLPSLLPWVTPGLCPRPCSPALPPGELSCPFLPHAPSSWTVLPFMLVLGSKMF